MIETDEATYIWIAEHSTASAWDSHVSSAERPSWGFGQMLFQKFHSFICLSGAEKHDEHCNFTTFRW